MPRALSSNTKLAYWWAWASARDIARVTGLKPIKVSNALKRGERRSSSHSDRLGRTFKAVDRYIPSNAGGARALARRLEVVEMAYRYLPGFWRSNLVSEPTVHVSYTSTENSPISGEMAR